MTKITRKMKTPWGRAFKKHYNQIFKDHPGAKHQDVFVMAGRLASVDMKKAKLKRKK